MEKDFHYNSEKIINKLDDKLEGLSADAADALVDRLREPFKSNVDFELTYKEPSLEEQSQVLDYIQYVVRKGRGETDHAYQEVKNWKKVTRFTFDISGKQVNILNSGPFLYDLYICPMEREPNGATSFDDRAVYVCGELNNLAGLLITLHEIGHLWDFDQLQKMAVTRLTDDHEYSEQAEKLRQERTATAFAFKYARKYFSDPKQRADMVSFLKNYALASYYKYVRMDIVSREALKKAGQADYGDVYDNGWDDYYDESPDDPEFERKIKDLDTWMRRYEFDDWKLTPAYTTWKTEQYSGTEDELEEWVKWIEKTGYDYQKDIEKFFS